MVQQTLKLLSDWYELDGTSDKPLFISKLAVIELYGWIEEEFDRIMLSISHQNNCNEQFIKRNVIDKNSSFTYNRHIRYMVSLIIGEYGAACVDQEFEARFPGDKQRLENLLATLVSIRNNHAHTTYNSQSKVQKQFPDPSSLIGNHYIPIADLLQKYELALNEVCKRLYS